MEKLIIEDFLSIKKAEVDLKRINIFIGPQAKGKSLISKLISFFKEIPMTLQEAGVDEKSKRQFDSDLKAKFESIFPKYGWEKSKFKIGYSCDYYSIQISHDKTNAQYKWCIKYSDSVLKTLTSARKVYKKAMIEGADGKYNYKIRSEAMRELREVIIQGLYGESADMRLEQVFYIPAGRSFFANLQKNVFSFISSSIPIDHFLKEFGAIYERTRERGFIEFAHTRRPKSVERIVNDLICGSYLSEKGQDWIISSQGRVNLSNSSSGQQEVLPMAMVLSTWPYASSVNFTRSFIVEEPEAHLFPIAQGQIVSLIASAYNARDKISSYTITTHSPYILTAFNNLIQAGNVLEKTRSSSERAQLASTVPLEQIVRFEDVTAYFVDRGVVKEIMDHGMNLIDASAIDNVSEHFAQKFEKLIDMELEFVESGTELSE
ncbi:AAA family ATPase [Pseudomonas sp. PDM27]|uniref:AAA family ATPase n=1 Tax=Pseudomonas sp. PDM27 TaxID=2854769 RepID=UPI001C46EB59|nr:AAA family ATPase [Pseudomonas sp. PDM27]MBV7569664.1 ATP-binding protein [Pseudomonas sp. PDM27]